MNYKSIFILVLLFVVTHPLTMQLTSPQTCLELKTEEPQQQWLINYHHNFHQGTASLKIFLKNGQILADSGKGTEYKHNMEVTFPVKGMYLMCFEKDTPQQLEVSFEILKMGEEMAFVGKEDLSRLARRIGQFLVEIKNLLLKVQ